MSQHADPDPTAPPPSDEPDAPVTPDDLVEAADDPRSDKERTGRSQAEANRDDEPPA
jgi:hypothetical protein